MRKVGRETPVIEMVTSKPRKASRRPKLPRHATKGKKKTKSLSKYKKELDTVFSRWIRFSAVGADGLVECYTCRLRFAPEKIQNGHFVPRQYLAVRWDEVNCHPQCYADNMLFNCQPSAYAKRLDEDYGPGTVAMLEGKRKTLTKLKEDYYEFWIPIYQNKLKELSTPGN